MGKLNIYDRLVKVETILNEDNIIKLLNKDINFLENKIKNSSSIFDINILTLFDKYNKIINDFYYKKKIELDKIDEEKLDIIKEYIKVNSKLSKLKNIDNDFIFTFYFCTNDISETLNILFLKSINSHTSHCYIKNVMNSNEYIKFSKNLKLFLKDLNIDIYLKKKLGIAKNEITENRIKDYFNDIKIDLNLNHNDFYNYDNIETKFNLLKLKLLENNSKYINFWNYYDKNNKKLNILENYIYSVNKTSENKTNNLKKKNNKNTSFIKNNNKIIKYRKFITEIRRDNKKQKNILNLYKNEYLILNNELNQMEKNIYLKKNLKNLKNLQMQINFKTNNSKLIYRQKIQEEKLIDLTFNHKLDLILQKEKINKFKEEILNLENNINNTTKEYYKNKLILDTSNINKDVLNINSEYSENHNFFYHRKKYNLHMEKIIFLDNHDNIKTNFEKLCILNKKKNLLIAEIRNNKNNKKIINYNLNKFFEKGLDNEINFLTRDLYFPDIINKKLKNKIKLIIKKKIEVLIYIFIIKYEYINNLDNIDDYIIYLLVKNIKIKKINIKDEFNKYKFNYLKNFNYDIHKLNHNLLIKENIINFNKKFGILKKKYNILSKFI
mgnify:CR=1 FL=1|tara:strand:- start:9526 stop:11355 length:1830 start_codon:yes stop_codon:yes gene_type:complete